MVKDTLQRLWVNLITDERNLRAALGADGLKMIEDVIGESEESLSAEIAVAIEHSLSPREILSGLTPRKRAMDLFSTLRVWDTEANSGILLYVLLADHAVEILVDRGISSKINDESWEQVCHVVEEGIRSEGLVAGVTAGIRKIAEIVTPHFPPDETPKNSLSNKPFLV